MKKLPKKFYTMSLTEQEIFLVAKLGELYEQEDRVKKMLAKVRGGYKYEPSEEIRPDEIILKQG